MHKQVLLNIHVLSCRYKRKLFYRPVRMGLLNEYFKTKNGMISIISQCTDMRATASSKLACFSCFFLKEVLLTF